VGSAIKQAIEKAIYNLVYPYYWYFRERKWYASNYFTLSKL